MRVRCLVGRLGLRLALVETGDQKSTGGGMHGDPRRGRAASSRGPRQGRRRSSSLRAAALLIESGLLKVLNRPTLGLVMRGFAGAGWFPARASFLFLMGAIGWPSRARMNLWRGLKQGG